MGISQSLIHKISEHQKDLETAVMTLKEAEAQINALTESFPVVFDAKIDFQTLTLKTANMKHLANRSRKNAVMVSKIARQIWEAVLAEASLDGVYEHFKAYEIQKNKVTDSMKEKYALSHDEVLQLSAVVAESEALAEFFRNESASLETTEVEFRNFAKDPKGM